MHVDARDARKANKELFNQWIEDYGINSDFVRVRVLGLFPIGASVSFIAPADISNSIARNAGFDFRSLPHSVPTIMGIDVARSGSDQSVFIFRKGRWVSPQIYRYDEPDLMRLASYAAEKIRFHEPDLVMVDEVGIGAGVLDRLRQLGFAAIGVHAGARPDELKLYRNKRAELWARMKTWMKEGGIIPNDVGLRTALEIPGYSFTDANEKLLLESKESIKARGARSPDEADAVALTFAMAVPVKIQDQEYNLEPEVV
jgi:hypothetical protein